jgi:HNH endonuclease
MEKRSYQSSRSRRLGMPKKEAILKYWNIEGNYQKLGTLPCGYSFPNEQGSCFACGNPTILHRAHIVPLIKQVNNDVNNIHLLCPGCHNESENIVDYWKWLHYKRANHWKDKVFYIIERMKMHGINIDQEAHRHESLGSNYKKRELHIIGLFKKIGLLINKK